VRRALPALVALGLLVGSAASFALAERLKLEPSPISGTVVDKVFSPICDCPTDQALISFRLRESATLTVDVLDTAGRTVRTLAEKQRRQKGRIFYRWDGRDDEGEVVPEGLYRPRIQLERHGRTFSLPNRIRVDTTPPVIRVTGVVPLVFSPDGDGRRDRVTVRYVVDEKANPILLVDGARRAVGRFRPLVGKLDWFGIVRGRSVRAGTYDLALRGVDVAGNRSRITPPVAVKVRYIELRRRVVELAPGRRFVIGVSTDAASYRWRFAGRSGTGRGPVLVFQAPRAYGGYTVFVAIAGGHADAALVIVRAP
jgi:hypothetical protein